MEGCNMAKNVVEKQRKLKKIKQRVQRIVFGKKNQTIVSFETRRLYLLVVVVFFIYLLCSWLVS
ncbi:hypothetical protein PJ964_002763 [Enterococcus faecalis]|nr:hypothetical protein [Enterococcus faecalis]EGO2657077.1 hypothetical protein [Enterococcus faecalis]EGO2662923.1 hypothetical protein [Enterococcus faecalis]EGO5091459.1 hypothetical protein [Enterococcus faecalis]EGO6786516.1 hypothetical protein [Enterococcus faecalis]